jgi:adenylate kinase
MAGISDPFAGFGPSAKAKFLILGSSNSLMDRARSLNLEHVSPALVKGPEISRRPVSTAAIDASLLALMRRWFFARKPDAGFFLTEFPATLLQAKMFDEWLEARNESLDAVVVGPNASEPLVEHYHTLGLILTGGDMSPLEISSPQRQ